MILILPSHIKISPFGHCPLNNMAFTSMIPLPLLRHFSCCHKHANPFTYYQITFLSTTISSLFFLLLLHNPYLSQLFWRGKETVVDTTESYFTLNSQSLLGYWDVEWLHGINLQLLQGLKREEFHFICKIAFILFLGPVIQIVVTTL